MHDIKNAVQSIQNRIASAAHRSGRQPSDVRLMAVSKFHSAEEICTACECGLRLFGENRVQEAAEKFPSVFSRYPQTELHMIGSLQRNKVRMIVPIVSCIQSVDRIELLEQIIIEKQKILQKKDIDPGLDIRMTGLSVLFEVHTGEESKSGFLSPDEICRAVEFLLMHPESHITAAGFMTMAPFTQNKDEVRSSFKKLVSTANFVRSRFPDVSMPVLSMGMSNDFETAVEEGSTLVRVGTAIFGERR